MSALPEVLWRQVNGALDAGCSPWDDADVLDWLAEHPDDFAPLERALERVHLGSRLARADVRPPARPRARVAIAAGIALAALAPLAARFTPPHVEAPAPRAAALTVYALEIRVDRATPRPASLTPTGAFAHVDVRVETLTRRNPRR